MKILNKVSNFIDDHTYKIIIFDNKINIVNYTEIIDFNSKEIIIKNGDNVTNISGNNLVISKILDNELLIEGDISGLKL